MTNYMSYRQDGSLAYAGPDMHKAESAKDASGSDFKSKLLDLDNSEIGQIVKSFQGATAAQRARAIERLSSIIGGIAELNA